MKRFGMGAVVGFAVVFGSFYLMGMRGEAGEHAFESLTHSNDHSGEDARVKEESKPFSALGEPSVQEANSEINTKEKSKKVSKRIPSSTEGEMQVSLRKVKEKVKEPESEYVAKKVAMVESRQKPEEHHESAVAGAYSVQVASNTDKAASDVMLERLQAKGFEGYVQAATVNEKQYYRVRLGPVASKDAAHELKDKALQIKGISNAIISKDL